MKMVVAPRHGFTEHRLRAFLAPDCARSPVGAWLSDCQTCFLNMGLSLAGLPPALLFASALIMAAARAPTVGSQATAARTSASNAPPVELSDRDAVSAHTHAQLGYDYARQGNR